MYVPTGSYAVEHVKGKSDVVGFKLSNLCFFDESAVRSFRASLAEASLPGGQPLAAKLTQEALDIMARCGENFKGTFLEKHASEGAAMPLPSASSWEGLEGSRAQLEPHNTTAALEPALLSSGPTHFQKRQAEVVLHGHDGKHRRLGGGEKEGQLLQEKRSEAALRQKEIELAHRKRQREEEEEHNAAVGHTEDPLNNVGAQAEDALSAGEAGLNSEGQLPMQRQVEQEEGEDARNTASQLEVLQSQEEGKERHERSAVNSQIQSQEEGNKDEAARRLITECGPKLEEDDQEDRGWAVLALRNTDERAHEKPEKEEEKQTSLEEEDKKQRRLEEEKKHAKAAKVGQQKEEAEKQEKQAEKERAKQPEAEAAKAAKLRQEKQEAEKQAKQAERERARQAQRKLQQEEAEKQKRFEETRRKEKQEEAARKAGAVSSATSLNAQTKALRPPRPPHQTAMQQMRGTTHTNYKPRSWVPSWSGQQLQFANPALRPERSWGSRQ